MSRRSLRGPHRAALVVPSLLLRLWCPHPSTHTFNYAHQTDATHRLHCLHHQPAGSELVLVRALGPELALELGLGQQTQTHAGDRCSEELAVLICVEGRLVKRCALRA